ncbi:hypothetical protein NPIL_345421 [Nephila pilipes]|uniref:Uncharacterized protein n=1 Tax=Nephila pilipes TaxID=299642 RepID=A0A8X6NT04_NEPPI|nr:hypothetical protein NPIL_345421 [Nephila pilipes]
MDPCRRNSWWIIPRLSKNTSSIVFVFDFDARTFIGRPFPGLVHSELRRLVSGSYSRHHDSSPVTMVFKKLGSSSAVAIKFSEEAIRCSFCSVVRVCGTKHAQFLFL